MENVDVLIIGSGFGGSVMACRMAEKGSQVVVLERGRRWLPEAYPSVSQRDWFWDEDEPEKQNGWLDFRYFGDMSIATGAGVGGGSLIYANVSIEARPEAFAHGWPEAIDYTTLKPHYDTTGVMLNVQELPANQWTARTHLMKEGAEAVGAGERFRIVPQAITFDPDWSPERDDPYDYGLFTGISGGARRCCLYSFDGIRRRCAGNRPAAHFGRACHLSARRQDHRHCG